MKSKKNPIETVSECCGSYPVLDSEDQGICSECYEHCDYVCAECDNSGYYETNIDGADVECICQNCNSDQQKPYN
jgi:hypothetical protein